jgi:hypothetical protein
MQARSKPFGGADDHRPGHAPVDGAVHPRDCNSAAGAGIIAPRAHAPLPLLLAVVPPRRRRVEGTRGGRGGRRGNR